MQIVPNDMYLQNMLVLNGKRDPWPAGNADSSYAFSDRLVSRQAISRGSRSRRRRPPT